MGNPVLDICNLIIFKPALSSLSLVILNFLLFNDKVCYIELIDFIILGFRFGI